MSVQHQTIITDTKRPTLANYPAVYDRLPGIIIDTKGNNSKPASDSDEVNRIILTAKTPGAGNQDSVKKVSQIPDTANNMANKPPKTAPRSIGQIPYAGKNY